MRVGVVILPELRWKDAEPLWQRAEALGFDHAWTYDHLAWSTLRDSTWFGAIPTLTAAALATSTIRVGTLVASPNFRHPAVFARELTALDDISAGRLTLGLGSGGTGWDATILGQDPWSPIERADRFAEFTLLLDRLLRQPATDYAGRYYKAEGARSAPGCVQQPRVPFAIAATGPRGMKLAAEHGAAWVTYGPQPYDGAPLEPAAGAAAITEQIEQLSEACVAVGREPATLARLVLTGGRLRSALESPTSFADACGLYAEAGVTDLVVHWPRPTEPYAGDPALLENVFA